MDPKNALTIRNKGVPYLEKGKTEKALELSEEAKKLDNETELIHYFLGMAYYNSEKINEAKEELKKSKDLGNLEAAAMLGKI